LRNTIAIRPIRMAPPPRNTISAFRSSAPAKSATMISKPQAAAVSPGWAAPMTTLSPNARTRASPTAMPTVPIHRATSTSLASTRVALSSFFIAFPSRIRFQTGSDGTILPQGLMFVNYFLMFYDKLESNKNRRPQDGGFC